MTPSQPATIGGLSPDAFSSVFQSINGLRNRRALFAMLGCMIAGVLLAGLFSLLASRMGFFMAFLGFVAMFVASATGINAAGVLLMDQARGVPSRPLMDAVVYGLMCIPKFIALALLLLLVAIAVFVVLAIVYFVCKIPVLGPLLFVVVFPVSVVISGLTLSGLFLCMFLALPAIWEGATITRAVMQALAIARSRLVESILLLAVVGLLAGVVGFIVFGVLFSGLMPSAGLAASILGGDGLGSVIGMMRSRGEMGEVGAAEMAAGGGGSYALAAGIGGALLWALAGSLLSLVYLLGLNIVYLRVTEALDVGATEAALRARFDDAKRGAADLGQKAKDAAERARDKARQSAAAAQASAATAMAPKPAEPVVSPTPQPAESTAPPVAPLPRAAPPDSTTPAVSKAITCPQCLSAIGKDDMFCGVCGYRLK